MKKIIFILMFCCLFAQNKKYGFGFTFDGGNTIMNIINLSSGLSTTAITPTLYLSENLSQLM